MKKLTRLVIVTIIYFILLGVSIHYVDYTLHGNNKTYSEHKVKVRP